MNSVGIGVSKGKTMIAVMRPFGEVVASPIEIHHTDNDLCELANYGLDHWFSLPRYVPEEDTRLMRKNYYRQYQQYSKVQTMLRNNLISLLKSPEIFTWLLLASFII